MIQGIKKEEESFVRDILKKLLLTKQQVETQYGFQETSSILERVLDDIKNKFQIDQKIIEELKIDFVEYLKVNKDKILEKISNELIERIKRMSGWEIERLIGSEIFEKIIKESLLSNENFNKAVEERIKIKFPELGEKIKEGKVEIKVDVQLK